MTAQTTVFGRATGVTVRYLGLGGVDHEVDLVDAATIRFEDLPAYRELVSYKGQRSFAGLWWFATTGTHVPYGSWVQRDQVMVADHRPEVVALRSQPFAVNLTLATGAVWHVPDYFARLRDGRGQVIDVRPAGTSDTGDQAIFTATAEICAMAGWGYAALEELTPARRANLRWLAAYRHERNAHAGPPWEVLRATVADRTQITLGDLPGATGVSAIALFPQVYHRLWTGQLRTDLSQLLTMRATVTAGDS